MIIEKKNVKFLIHFISIINLSQTQIYVLICKYSKTIRTFSNLKSNHDYFKVT